MKRIAYTHLLLLCLASFSYAQTAGEELQSIFSDINALMSEQQDERFFQRYEGHLKEAKSLLDQHRADPTIRPYQQLYEQYEQRLALLQPSTGSEKKTGGLKSFGRKVAGASPFGGPEKYEDHGVANEVHQRNLGKIRFGSYTYGGTPTFSADGSLTDPVTYHLFLPASVVNLAQKEGKETGDKRWNAVTSNGIQFVLTANGEKYFDWLEVNPDGPDPDTYYSGIVLNEKRQKALINPMKAGSNTIKVEAYLYNKTIRDTHKKKVAEGIFEVKFTEEELTKTKERELQSKRNILSQVMIYNGLNQKIKVQSTNLVTDGYHSATIAPLQQKIFYYHSENGSGIRISYAGSSRLIKHIPMEEVPYDIIRVP